MTTISTTPRTQAQTKVPRVAVETITLSEFADKLDISYSSAWELARRDALPVPVLRLGRQYRFSKTLVDRALGVEERGDA